MSIKYWDSRLLESERFVLAVEHAFQCHIRRIRELLPVLAGIVFAASESQSNELSW